MSQIWGVMGCSLFNIELLKQIIVSGTNNKIFQLWYTTAGRSCWYTYLPISFYSLQQGVEQEEEKHICSVVLLPSQSGQSQKISSLVRHQNIWWNQVASTKPNLSNLCCKHPRKAFNRRILHLGFLHLPLVFIRCCRLLKFQGESFFKLWMSAVDAFLPSISIAILSRHQKKNLQITSYSFFMEFGLEFFLF